LPSEGFALAKELSEFYIAVVEAIGEAPSLGEFIVGDLLVDLTIEINADTFFFDV
jgi:hypothetical protein